ncbi:hypothetical protein RhiirA5_439603 [Rhizophagus irregularis]|uniref:Uncharacterized protein n=1 Tax=Rhizophagus irregularis TaxID=588596 RepID=A0A2N0NHP2_9GLOM|nr:hypothetical protein RhiirA5_439603 [Rhizophagus irregularis]
MGNEREGENEAKKLSFAKKSLIFFAIPQSAAAVPSVSYATFSVLRISLVAQDVVFDGPGHMGGDRDYIFFEFNYF